MAAILTMLLFCTTLFSVFSQTAGSASPSATPLATTPNPGPTANAAGLPLATPTPQTTPLTGTWIVERAIYDLYNTLKDVAGTDESFYAKLVFGPGNKGKITYNGKADAIDMEYDTHEQTLTLAFGSRLKPQVDLYRMVLMNDGTIFLKSQRMASKNGIIHYILRKLGS